MQKCLTKLLSNMLVKILDVTTAAAIVGVSGLPGRIACAIMVRITGQPESGHTASEGGCFEDGK